MFSYLRTWHWGWICIGLLASVTATNTLAVQRALLVGVSELVNQPQSLWLQAPRNDVILMRDSLLRQGFAMDDITVLADGVANAQLPDAALIHEALAKLLRASQPGDFVMLYFSGHGTRIRDTAKQYQEPDGLAETFLTRDTRGSLGATTGGGASLGGGIRDVEFDGWVNAFLAKNVFVWSLFDTCSAASMTRGADRAVSRAFTDDEVRFRGVSPSQLSASNVTAGRGAPPPQTKEAIHKARYVAFFASESHQVTPELRLPRKKRDARQHGLLTWAVSEALKRQPETWRDLYHGVLDQYPPVIEELELRFPNREMPSPVAEGSLDYRLFSNQELSASVRPIWPALRSGLALTVKNGLLDGLEAQQSVRVSAIQSNGTAVSALGSIKAVELNSARLDIPSSLTSLSTDSSWSVTPVNEPTAIGLKVRFDVAPPSGFSLLYPASVQSVSDGAYDVRVSSAPPSGYRVEVLQNLNSAALSPSVNVLADAITLQKRLQDLAQWKWLVHITQLTKSTEIDGFSAWMEINQGGRLVRVDRMQSSATGKPLSAGEQAQLVVRNASGQSIDLLIAEFDERGGLRVLYPDSQSESNRFERGTRQAPSSKRFAVSSNAVQSGGRLVVVAGLVQPQSPPRLFGVNVRERTELKIRGSLTPDKERQVFASLMRWSDDAASNK
jgi:hypothetical protein